MSEHQDQPPDAVDEMWARAALELSPEKTLARVSENARSVITTVGVVGVLLSGLGLAAATAVLDNPILLAGALLSGGLSSAAVAIALKALIARNRDVSPANLIEVEQWFTEEIGRRRGAALASVLLFAAAAITSTTIVLGGIGVFSEALTRSVENQVRVERVFDTDGSETLRLVGNVEGLPKDSAVRVVVEHSGRPIFRYFANADDNGQVNIETVTEIPANAQLVGRMTIFRGEEKLESLDLRLQ